jgi:hypothetical protein
MPGRIVGGQTSAGQADWRAARAFGICTGGRMPRGSLTEDGPRPERAVRYGAHAMLTADVGDSDGAPWFAATDTPGVQATFRVCQGPGKSCARVQEGLTRPSHVATWIGENKIKVLNVADNRGSNSPASRRRATGPQRLHGPGLAPDQGYDPGGSLEDYRTKLQPGDTCGLQLA